MQREKLTKSQHKIMCCIQDFITKYGYSPTVRDIAEITGLSTGGINNSLDQLTDKRYIDRKIINGRASNRSIVILAEEYLPKKKDIVKVPILGNVAAGNPILAVEDVSGYLPVSSKYIDQDAKTFALKVCGDSMRDIGIMDGDTVIIDAEKEIRNRDVVVAMINDDVTVKRYIPLKGNEFVELLPENKEMKPMYFPLDQVHVLGKVIGKFRMYDD